MLVFTNVLRGRLNPLDTTHLSSDAAADAVLGYLDAKCRLKVVKSANSNVRHACGLLCHLPPLATHVLHVY